MTELKHTEGPWEWIKSRMDDGYLGLVSESGEEVLFPQCANDGDTGRAWFEEVSDADRILIQSAPVLLDLCEMAVEEIVRLQAAKDDALGVEPQINGVAMYIENVLEELHNTNHNGGDHEPLD